MKNILAIGAHADDVEFGCGGTLIKHIENGDNVVIVVMARGNVQHTVTGEIVRVESKTIKESKASAKFIGAKLIKLSYEDTRVPFNSKSVTDLEKIISEYKIDTIYTHWAADTHQDHINTFRSTLASARTIKNVLSYEQVPLPRISEKTPELNYFVDISDYFDKKIESCNLHKSQIEKYINYGYDMIENLEIMARHRGNQIGVRYAEAFNLLKMVK